MRYIGIVFIFCIFFSIGSANAEEKNSIAYYKLEWGTSLEKAKDRCEPHFAVSDEKRAEYYCEIIEAFEGVDFSKGSGVAKKNDLFRPKIEHTILKFLKSDYKSYLSEVEIIFSQKDRKSLLVVYKQFYDILVAEFGQPRKSAKPGEMDYLRLNGWKTPNVCIFLQVPISPIKGYVRIMPAGKCGGL